MKYEDGKTMTKEDASDIETLQSELRLAVCRFDFEEAESCLVALKEIYENKPMEMTVLCRKGDPIEETTKE